MTDSDFRNTYSIVGICAIDNQVSPLLCTFAQGINDAKNFTIQVKGVLNAGWLLRHDILVADNSAIHMGKENVVLEEWLWEYHHVYMLFLPARAPELNPTDLIWNILVQRLKIVDLCALRQHGRGVVHAAVSILNKTTHQEVDNCYRHCGK